MGAERGWEEGKEQDEGKEAAGTGDQHAGTPLWMSGGYHRSGGGKGETGDGQVREAFIRKTPVAGISNGRKVMGEVADEVSGLPRGRVLSYVTNVSTPTRVRVVAWKGIWALAIFHFLVAIGLGAIGVKDLSDIRHIFCTSRSTWPH